MFIQELLQLQEAAKAEKVKCFKISWPEGYGKQKPQKVGMNWFTDDMGFGKDDIEEIADLGVGQEWTGGGPRDTVSVQRLKDCSADKLQESVEELTEKVFDEDKYTWYVWTQRKPSQAFERRGGAKSLEKGMQFGLRPATSKKGTWRLIIKQNGPSIIFSIDDATAKAVAKASLELK